MIRRILIAFSVEFANAIRLNSTYIGPLVVVLVILAASFVHPIANDDESDYAFIAYSVPMALNLVGVIMLMLYCSTLISADLGSGTIRTILVRPLRRRDYFFSKLLMGFTYTLVLITLAALTAWLLAFILGNLTGIHFGDEIIYTDSDMRTGFLLALLLSLMPLFTTVTYALMISTFTRSNVAAVSTSIGLWIVVDFLKQPLRIQTFFFSTYLESAWEMFADRCDALDTDWQPIAQQSALVCFSSAFLFIIISLIVLSRRNLSA